MFEINPVLAGTFDGPNYAPSTSNIDATAPADQDTDTSQTSAVADSRRYTQFDRSVTDAGSTTNFSFHDFLDMVNPLEHIPVLSSVYRAIAGETINPVARVAGDMIYGGALGGMSAVLGGLGGIANATVEQETGKDANSNIIASIFDTDKTPAPTQLASATPQNETLVAGAASQTDALNNVVVPAPTTPNETPSTASSSLAAAAPLPTPTQTPAPAATPSSSAPALTLASNATTGNAVASGTIPLAPLKSASGLKPFGGVMAPPNAEAQNMAIALASAAPAGIRMGHTIYTNHLLSNSPHPVTMAPRFVPSVANNGAAGTLNTTLHVATTNAAAALNAPIPNATGGAAPNIANLANTINTKAAAAYGLPSGLLDDIAALKATNQYKNVATTGTSPGTNGTTVNTTN
jgi:hypothetical protein